MRVEILYPRTWQDAGRNVPLNVGEVCDLPDVVAQSLIATGAAKAVGVAKAIVAAPERKPTGPRERKG